MFSSSAVLEALRSGVVRGGELIREARARAGLTQADLAQRTGRDRSVIARWEHGAVSPPVESLLACVHACGFDIPLMLVALDRSVDAELGESLRLTPSERVTRMLDTLTPGADRGNSG